jgi:AraC-like DNA-binding protein
MQKIKTLHIYLFLLCCHSAVAQQFTTVPDSLKKYSYLDLADKVVTNTSKDPLVNQKNYIYAYADLLKAKKENNIEEIFYGYTLMSNAIPDFSLAMQYSDSACSLSYNKMPKLVSRAYFDRGYLYYTDNKLKDALDCFVIASRDTIYPSKYLQNRIHYSIGMIKSTQGDYQEALPIYIKCEKNARIHKLYNYLGCLLGLSEVYNRTNNIGLSEQCTNKGIALRTKDDLGETYYPYFIGNRGKNEYKRKHYATAIVDLISSIQTFKKSGDHSNYAENSFFIGECYREQHLEEKAIPYYKKVDSVFTIKNDIYAIDIPAYKHLIAYYKKKQDYQRVIYYSDQFIKADKLINDNYKYISSKIAKTYDIQKVVAGKQALITSLNNDKKTSAVTIALLLFSVTSLGGLYFFKTNQNKKEKALFDAYIKEREQKTPPTIEPIQLVDSESKKTTIDINVVHRLATSLIGYEKNEGFLNNQTIEELAKDLNTNSNYLAKVIKEIKGYNFTQYINALRMEYILKKLETDKVFLEYKILTLSQKSGYNSVETFARAFREHTKLNPSDFIKLLKNRSVKKQESVNFEIDRTSIS